MHTGAQYRRNAPGTFAIGSSTHLESVSREFRGEEYSLQTNWILDPGQQLASIQEARTIRYNIAHNQCQYGNGMQKSIPHVAWLNAGVS